MQAEMLHTSQVEHWEPCSLVILIIAFPLHITVPIKVRLMKSMFTIES